MNKVTGEIKLDSCVFKIHNGACENSLRCEALTTSGFNMKNDLMYLDDEYGPRLCLILWEQHFKKIAAVVLDRKPIVLWKHTIINP